MSNEKNEHHGPEPKKSARIESEIRYVPLDIRPLKNDDEEIKLAEILQKLWDGRKVILKTVIIFAIIGLLVGLLSVEEYTSEVKVMPERQEGMALGRLGGLAQQFGFSAGAQQTSDGISANLYPSIIKSDIFVQELMNYKVLLPDRSEEVTLEEYFKKYQKNSIIGLVLTYTIKLPFTLKNWLMSRAEDNTTSVDSAVVESEKQSRLIRMSKEDWRILKKIKDRISANMDPETGVVTVSVQMQDAEIAANVADEVVQKLSEYITEKRTEKARRDVEFIEERFEEAEDRFEEAQKELATFNDANRGQLTAMARTEEQKLLSRYDLNFNLYNSLAERLEEARIKLQEETPVVNILEPAAIPYRRSKPKRTQLLILSILFGGVVGIGLIFGLEVWNKFKEN